MKQTKEAMSSPPSRRSNETLIRRIISRSEVVELLVKRAAMFGLDARIALAIFGALSVISGAALYSAIKTAKVEQARQYFEEHIKASSAYYLDAGQQLPIFTGHSNDYVNTSELVENTANADNWHGPYISGTASSPTISDSFCENLYSGVNYRIHLRQSSTWAKADLITDEMCVAGSSDCAEWHALDANSANAKPVILQLFNDLDEFIDNGDGALAGTIRYSSVSSGFLLYKGRMRKKV